MGRELRGEWIHVYVWLSPFAVHLKLSQHYSLAMPQNGLPCGSEVKVSPAMRETWVRLLGWEDLEVEMAMHSSILAWRIP